MKRGGTPGRIIDKDGYARVKHRGHPRAKADGYVYEHILIAETALGKPLPPKAVVHHHNGDGADNANRNLVICENQAYHLLLHRRMTALRATGDPNKLICVYCGRYDDPGSLRVMTNSRACHRSCAATYEIERLNKINPNRKHRPRRKYVDHN